jgi:hypothetical protein
MYNAEKNLSPSVLELLGTSCKIVKQRRDQCRWSVL